jgi:hypothetical protein
VLEEPARAQEEDTMSPAGSVFAWKERRREAYTPELAQEPATCLDELETAAVINQAGERERERDHDRRD